MEDVKCKQALRVPCFDSPKPETHPVLSPNASQRSTLQVNFPKRWLEVSKGEKKVAEVSKGEKNIVSKLAFFKGKKYFKVKKILVSKLEKKSYFKVNKKYYFPSWLKNSLFKATKENYSFKAGLKILISKLNKKYSFKASVDLSLSLCMPLKED